MASVKLISGNKYISESFLDMIRHGLLLVREDGIGFNGSIANEIP
jgi:hypothetical protein